MAGLARLARAAKGLDDMYAFVEDVEAAPEVEQRAVAAGLGDASEWIRPLRDLLTRRDYTGSNPVAFNTLSLNCTTAHPFYIPNS
jgi:hypothetical protein